MASHVLYILLDYFKKQYLIKTNIKVAAAAAAAGSGGRDKLNRNNHNNAFWERNKLKSLISHLVKMSDF